MSRRRREPEPWDAAPQTAPRTPFERSARFWLNAYPRRWRDQHGEELLGVLEDVARGSTAELPGRLPRAEVLGLVKAGWSLRWREHPPFWRWLAYRTFDRRLPERYWWWVADDIRSPFFTLVNNSVSGLTPLAVMYVAYLALSSEDPIGWLSSPLFWLIYGGVLITVAYLTRNGNRRRAWLRHVVDGNVPESMRHVARDEPARPVQDRWDTTNDR